MVGLGGSPRAFQLVRGCARDDGHHGDDNPGSQLPSNGLSSLQLFPQRDSTVVIAPFLRIRSWLSGGYLLAMAYASSGSIFRISLTLLAQPNKY